MSVTTADYHKLTNQAEKERHVLALLFQIRAAGLPEPQQEVLFHPRRKWKLDFAWPGRKLAVELHGAVFANGRHNRGAGFTEDRRKMNEALLAGWKVLEVTSEMVTNGEAIQFVEKAWKGA